MKIRSAAGTSGGVRNSAASRERLLNGRTYFPSHINLLTNFFLLHVVAHSVGASLPTAPMHTPPSRLASTTALHANPVLNLAR